MKKLLTLLCCSYLSSFAYAGNTAYPNEPWKMLRGDHDLFMYGNYTQEHARYFLSVDSTLDGSGLTADTISYDCAGTTGKLAAGNAIACTLPPQSMLKWSIDAKDAHNGSQGKKGVMNN